MPHCVREACRAKVVRQECIGTYPYTHGSSGSNVLDVLEVAQHGQAQGAHNASSGKPLDASSGMLVCERAGVGVVGALLLPGDSTLGSLRDEHHDC